MTLPTNGGAIPSATDTSTEVLLAVLENLLNNAYLRKRRLNSRLVELDGQLSETEDEIRNLEAIRYTRLRKAATQ